MARKSVNNVRSNRKLASLRKELRWASSQMESLSEVTKQEKAKEMARIGRILNKKLEKSAFEACDKEAYADFLMEETLRRYDIGRRKDWRSANHRCAKEIFRAAHKGQEWTAAIRSYEQKADRMIAKRNALCESLAKKKDVFIANHPSSNGTEYEAKRAELEQELQQKEAALNARLALKETKRRARLQKALDRCSAKMDKARQTGQGSLRLPEDVLLRVKGLKMYFGGLKAVDDLTFDVKKGEIFGLIGPNGAGKTTVFNCITRFYDATDGELYFENKYGETVDLRSFRVHDVIVQGISRTFQNVELVREISVLDNLLVACTQEYRSNLLVHALGLPSLRREERALKERAMKVLRFIGLENYAAWPAMGLPYGVLKKVEIARALMGDAKLIIMDEPAAGLNDTETAELTRTIRRIRDEFGVTILLVEHDMSLVMNVCDTVCAISFGKMLAIGTCDEIKRNREVQEAYLGVGEDD